MTAACAGPRTPLEIGSKEIPVNIVLGDQRQPVPNPPAASNPDAGFPGFIQPPLTVPEPGAPPEPAPQARACPIANPLDAALLAADVRAPNPPVPATYIYRNHGTQRVGAGAPTAYPPQTVHRVGGVHLLADGNYEFTVAATLAGVTTTTTYRVLNGGPTPDRGLYIVQVITPRTDGTESFQPSTPIQLLPFPSPEYGTNLEDEIANYRGTSYRSSGTDPLTQTTMVLQATVAGKTRVDACGTWVDAIDITVDSGRIVGPSKQIDFTGHYAVATQYGGLIVEDEITASGTEPNRQTGAIESIASTARSRINTLPRARA